MDSRPHFVPAHDEGHLAAPRVHEAGPAGIQGDVVAVVCAEANGPVLKGGVARGPQHFLVDGDHQRAVLRVQVREDGHADQVLRQVPQQRHGPGQTHRPPVRRSYTLKTLLSFMLNSSQQVHTDYGEQSHNLRKAAICIENTQGTCSQRLPRRRPTGQNVGSKTGDLCIYKFLRGPRGPPFAATEVYKDRILTQKHAQDGEGRKRALHLYGLMTITQDDALTKVIQ